MPKLINDLVAELQQRLNAISRAGDFAKDRTLGVLCETLAKAAGDVKTQGPTADNLRTLNLQFKTLYKVLGAPGNWGYGTPEGDACVDLYKTWNELHAALSLEAVGMQEASRR